jgi:hypothetical protein
MSNLESSAPTESQAVFRLLISRDDNLLRQVVIDRERMMIGRRPYCDLVLDDLTVSGEHAMLHSRAGESVLHDLQSRNGSIINGMAVRQQVLVHGDQIDIGVFKIKFVQEKFAGEATRIMLAVGSARILIMSGADAGKVVHLDRAITSIGSSSQVAVVARRRNGYYLTHMEGPTYPLVNGESIGLTAQSLNDRDLIELAGTSFQFQMGA